MTFCKGTLINNISDVTHILHFAFRFSSDTYDRKLIFWYILRRTTVRLYVRIRITNYKLYCFFCHKILYLLHTYLK